MDRNGIGIATVWMPGADKEVQAIAFPYFRDCQVINVKYRDNQKNFRQEKGAEKIFYGLDTVGEHETIVITEGEPDALALQEAGLLDSMGILSVPDGAPAIVKSEAVDPEEDAKFAYVWNCWAVLDRAKKVILAVDSDGPGRALAEELSRRIGRAKCWRVSWPSLGDAPRKDANEVLIEDGAQVLRECIEGAHPYPIRSLHQVRDFRDRVVGVYEKGRSRGLSTGWNNLDQFMTIAPGQFSVITGTPSSGKSEFVDALAMNLAAANGWKFAMCSFENEPAEDHLPKLAEKFLSMPFWDGPSPRMGAGDLNEALDWLEDYFTFIVADDESPTIDWILEKASDAVVRHGIRGLIVDPYSEIEHKRARNQTETEYVGQLIGKCKRFARVHGVHVWFVSHPAKMQRDSGGKIPVPSLYDISGSAHWTNKCDLGIVVHRDTLASGERSRETEIHVRKVRFRWMGRPGIATLTYDPKTGTYSEAG